MYLVRDIMNQHPTISITIKGFRFSKKCPNAKYVVILDKVMLFHESSVDSSFSKCRTFNVNTVIERELGFVLLPNIMLSVKS